MVFIARPMPRPRRESFDLNFLSGFWSVCYSHWRTVSPTGNVCFPQNETIGLGSFPMVATRRTQPQANCPTIACIKSNVSLQVASNDVQSRRSNSRCKRKWIADARTKRTNRKQLQWIGLATSTFRWPKCFDIKNIFTIQRCFFSFRFYVPPYFVACL